MSKFRPTVRLMDISIWSLDNNNTKMHWLFPGLLKNFPVTWFSYIISRSTACSQCLQVLKHYLKSYRWMWKTCICKYEYAKKRIMTDCKSLGMSPHGIYSVMWERDMDTGWFGFLVLPKMNIYLQQYSWKIYLQTSQINVILKWGHCNGFYSQKIVSMLFFKLLFRICSAFGSQEIFSVSLEVTPSALNGLTPCMLECSLWKCHG